MRNTSQGQRGAWATFAKEARERTPLTQTQLAEAIGVDRTTVWRWETDRQRPEDAEVVEAFARVTDVDLNEALAAAGLRPGVEPPVKPSREPDPEIELIRKARLSDAKKKQLTQHILMRRARDQETRLADLQILIQSAERNEP